MVFRMSIMNPLLAVVFCAALRLNADVVAASIRQSGAPLDTSIQNEVDRAVSQSVLWLCAQQRADGSWGGESNRVRLTAMVLCALNASRLPAASEPGNRAALWLGSTATNRIGALDTQAWRLLALVLVLPETKDRTALLRDLEGQAPAPTAHTPDWLRWFWRETVAAAGLGSPPQPDVAASNRLAQVAADWPVNPASNASAWPLARLVNRAGGGQLVKDGVPLDWRTDMARQVIGTQRRDPVNGGYWNAQDLDGKLEETALGILLLLEL